MIIFHLVLMLFATLFVLILSIFILYISAYGSFRVGSGIKFLFYGNDKFMYRILNFFAVLVWGLFIFCGAQTFFYILLYGLIFNGLLGKSYPLISDILAYSVVGVPFLIGIVCGFIFGEIYS